MKRKGFALVLVVVAILAGCTPAPTVSSSTASDFASSPVPPVEPAQPPTESTSSAPTSQQQAAVGFDADIPLSDAQKELIRVAEEIVAAVPPPPDSGYLPDQLVPVANQLGDLGVVVLGDYDTGVKNRNTKLADDYNKAYEAGQPALLVMVGFSKYQGLDRIYLYTDGGVSYSLTKYSTDGTLSNVFRMVETDPPRLTVSGYFVAEHQLFRATPLSEKCVEAYDNDVEQIDFFLNFREDWSVDGAAANIPMWIPQCLVKSVNPHAFAINSPYYNQQNDTYVFPQEMIEDLITKYFDVTVEDMRRLTKKENSENGLFYDAATQTYAVADWRGGGPAPFVEVWDVAENEDGTLDVSIAFIESIEDGAGTGHIVSVLTMQPRPDGGFYYLSNRTVQSDSKVPNYNGSS